MTKYSIWEQKRYYLSFGEEPVCFNIKVEIKQLAPSEFEARILSATLDQQEEQFACFLLKLLQTQELTAVYNELHSRILEEIKPSLFTLFYTGNLQHADYTPAQ